MMHMMFKYACDEQERVLFLNALQSLSVYSMVSVPMYSKYKVTRVFAVFESWKHCNEFNAIFPKIRMSFVLQPKYVSVAAFLETPFVEFGDPDRVDVEYETCPCHLVPIQFCYRTKEE